VLLNFNNKFCPSLYGFTLSHFAVAMGVTGLWTVVQPCARPIKIETLNRKRLAVDASIWIYQFLKAVRDKEGNALRNSHVVGFFRRICKLLFFGIKPVFVFDGGAPALKRQTISQRKKNREGRREDVVRTAGKMLALQMQQRAKEEERKRKEAESIGIPEPPEEIPEKLVYVEELTMTPAERIKNRKFKKQDQYHLPDLDVSMAEMGGPNDPRIMSMEELEQYARQFENGEDINVYDFSKIDFDSPFFISLPDSDRYNILNAARIRSRLRMGYSKEQLDTMFPDRMAFSKFQIERVKERNELTQRLMNINGMNDSAMWGINGTGRVAGDKNREYVLVKNDGVEGGWALGVVSSKEGDKKDNAIDVDKVNEAVEESQESDDDEWEDVNISSVNQLPKLPSGSIPGIDNGQGVLVQDLIKRREKFYQSRKPGSPKRGGKLPNRPQENPDSLFVAADPEEDVDWQDVEVDGDKEMTAVDDYDEEAELEKAIALSMQPDNDQAASGEEEDEFQEVFQNQKRAIEARPFAKGTGLAIARAANARSNKAASNPFDVSDEEHDVDSHPALAEEKIFKKVASPVRQTRQQSPITKPAAPLKASTFAPASKFSGPLPFESLNLGNSFLGKKKAEQIAEDNSGGFVKDYEDPVKKKGNEPLPPWFAGDVTKDIAEEKKREADDRKREEQIMPVSEEFHNQAILRNRRRTEIIDLEAPQTSQKDLVVIDSSDDEDSDTGGDGAATTEKMIPIDRELRMGDIADKVRAEPPISTEDLNGKSKPTLEEDDDDDEPIDWEESDHEHEPKERLPRMETDHTIAVRSKSVTPEFEEVPINENAKTRGLDAASESPPPEFEDVVIDIHGTNDSNGQNEASVNDNEDDGPIPASGLANDSIIIDEIYEDEHEYSDPEDEDLFRNLALEAEEHARFASELNNTSTLQTAEDFERELKQLRNQQKTNRRDADEVTQTMITECQQLLRLFGLPYITAPMEAEAQCAELVSLGLVDGIVTDDSDIFLFGGNRVYKNMFNQAKFVECYLAPDLEEELGLDRKKLIAIAQLLGSDYTEGLPGIGPVIAVELLSEFGSLEAFKDWWTGVQTGAIPTSADTEPGSSSFRRKFRKNQATKLFLPPSFPDPRVENAYLKPEVDNDPSEFAWGVPDLDALRNYLMATIGWSRQRTDEVLVPVIKDMNRREVEGTQSNITAFFGGSVGAGAFAPRRRTEGTSKRLENALGRMRDRAREDTNPEDGKHMEQSADANTGTKGKRKASKNTVRTSPIATTGSDDEDEEYEEPRKKAKKSSKTKSRG
jgi:DNA excision repair protein ERCC-5